MGLLHASSFSNLAQVYPRYDGAPQKPDLGDGLNKPAEITLYKIFKRDKATGEPITDPKEQQKFARKLEETATRQNTEFVSFDMDKGIWKFRVDHFSRLVLPCSLRTAAVDGLCYPWHPQSSLHAYCAICWASMQMVLFPTS